MIRKCTKHDLHQMVELAFKMNNQKEHYSAFCSLTRKSIHDEFEASVLSEEHMMVGSFRGDQLTGLLICFIDRERQNADCAGPFIDSSEEDYMVLAKQLFEFAKDSIDVEMKYTFFFSKENVNCKEFLDSINADRKVNEYELVLKKEFFIPYLKKVKISNLDKAYYNQFIDLHDYICPDIYVSGKDIIEDIGKSRIVFSIIEDDKLVAYSVLRTYKNAKTATAEIIAVEEKHRGKGYGKAILNYSIEFAFHNYNIEEIELIVDGDNETAISLYLSLGFTIKAENCCYVAR